MEIAESIEATRQSVIRMFQVLERAALLIMLYSGKNNMQQLAKPEKVYLDNTNLMYALSSSADIGNIRCQSVETKSSDTFFRAGRFSDR